jgi:predicted transcriptional regulator
MKLIQLLIDCGITPHESKILGYLLTHREQETSSRELERSCDLRQPEASIALKKLMATKWIGVVEQTSSGQGRPSKLYWLRISPEEIYNEIEQRFKKDIANLNNTLVQLKEAMTNPVMIQIKDTASGESSVKKEQQLLL